MKKFIIPFLTITLLISCKSEPYVLTKIEGKLLPVNSEIEENKDITKFIEPYKNHVEKEMNTVLSYTPITLTRTDAPLESSLGNLMADLCYEIANPVFNSRTGKDIDFAMFNYGGIRAGIQQGNITNSTAFQLMPFENSLVVVEMNADKIKELIQYLIAENRAHPLSKHINLTVKNDNYTVTINSKPLNNSETYYVLTSDYLQNGGDNMNFFKNPKNLYNLDYKVRNAIIDYFKSKDTIYTQLDGRFKKEN